MARPYKSSYGTLARSRQLNCQSRTVGPSVHNDSVTSTLGPSHAQATILDNYYTSSCKTLICTSRQVYRSTYTRTTRTDLRTTGNQNPESEQSSYSLKRPLLCCANDDSAGWPSSPALPRGFSFRSFSSHLPFELRTTPCEFRPYRASSGIIDRATLQYRASLYVLGPTWGDSENFVCSQIVRLAILT